MIARLLNAIRILRGRWSLAQWLQRLHIASAFIHNNYSAGVAMLVPDQDALRCLPLSTKIGAVCARAVIEVVIGDVVVRAGADTDEAHLRRVIRPVRSA